MKKQFLGLDMLRGTGIFTVLWLHSAFYYFDGLYELDFSHPPLIVTVIGLLLMFAGMFAIISGASHGIQYDYKMQNLGYSVPRFLKYNAASGLLVLAIAYAYFIFTGPGLVDIPNQTMNNSIFVEWIRNGRFKGFSLERLLYVDSLTMIGLNILLAGPIFLLVEHIERRRRPTARHGVYFLLGILFLGLSALRIPLYETYLEAVQQQAYGTVAALNWFVNKNNPILPFLAFGLLGLWLASMLVHCNWRQTLKRVIPVASILLLLGAALYVGLPDTMLERSIDLKWYAIMVAQMGLFPLLVLLFVWFFDQCRPEGVSASRPMPFLQAFIYRFGVAGLTPFFFESILSALVYRALKGLFPGIRFDLSGALLYGLLLAVLWGGLLILWEKKDYKYGLEYLYCRILGRFGESAKEAKLRGGAA